MKFILNREKRLKDITKPLYEKGCFTKAECDKVYPSGPKPEIFCSVLKYANHQWTTVYHFRSFYWRLAHLHIIWLNFLFLVYYFPIPIFSIHFCFLRKSDINFNGLMASLVAEILFTDIRLGESIDIINDVFVTTD